jgi:hypothetical protein
VIQEKVKNDSAHSALKLILSTTIDDQFLYNFLSDLIEQKIMDPNATTLTVNYDDLAPNKLSQKILILFKKITYSSRNGNSVEKFCSPNIFQSDHYSTFSRYQLLLVQDAINKNWGILIMECGLYDSHE